MNDFDLARADFQKVLQLYPSNKAAKAQLAVCQQRIRKQLAREKKLYANMFERLAEEESKVRFGTGNGWERQKKSPAPALGLPQPLRLLACGHVCHSWKPDIALVLEQEHEHSSARPLLEGHRASVIRAENHPPRPQLGSDCPLCASQPPFFLPF